MKKPILLLIILLFRLSLSGQVITTFAGTGFTGYGGDGGPATAALINLPQGIAADATGNIYFGAGGYIRKVNAAGIISTIAGTGPTGAVVDGVPAIASAVAGVGLFIDGAGNIYTAEFGICSVRKIDASGIITAVAGNGTIGYTGDSGPATAARLNNPTSVFIDGSGNMYIADEYNNCIRVVDPSGIIHTVAGTGTPGYTGDSGPATNATLNHPHGVIVDATGNIYIADVNNHAVRKITPAGIISTFAGTGTAGSVGDGGAATAAQLNLPANLAIDAGGTIYVSESGNHKVRKIDPSGIITTYSGTGTAGSAGDGGAPVAAQLNGPDGMCFDPAGNFYVTDINTQKVRKICNPPTPATLSGSTSVICIGGSTTLTASLGGGTWSTATGNATVGTTGIVTGMSAGVDTVRYILSNSCYFSKSEWPVTVNTIPSAGTISGTATVCPGAATTLSDAAPGGVWSSVSPSFASVDAAGTVTGIATGSSVISYTVTNSCGSNTASVTVTVNPLPVAGTITGVTSVCVGTSTTVSDAAPGGVWSSVFPSFATVDAAGNVAGIATGTDTIKYTVTNTCGTAVATYVISVNTTPTPVTITGSSPRCIGLADTFTSTGSGGAWTSSDATVATIGSASGIALGHTAGLAIISYTQTDACGTVSTAFPLTIIGPPIVGAITGVSSMCVSSIFTLTVPDTGGTWRSTNHSVAFMDTAGNIYGAGAGGTTISYTKTNACGTTAAMHTVTVLGIPHVSVITGADTVCAGSYIILHDSVSGGSWSAINARVSVVADTISAHITGTDTIMYRIINMCGRDSSTRIVHIIPPCDSSAFTGNAVITTSSLSVIPNPAHGEVTLKLTYSTNDEATVTITNELGQAVDHFTLPANKEKQLPLHLAPGLYNITATLNGDRYNAKVIIE